MGLKKFVKKLGKGVKKVAKVALPVAAAYYGGNALAGAIGASVPSESEQDSGFNLGDAIGSVWGSLKSNLPAISSAAGALAPYASGYMSGEAAEKANQWNLESSQRQMEYGREMAGRQEAFQRESIANQQAFNSAQASQQMAFQERMANTARQREVVDLKSAGLNPMMANMNGASAPAGASAASSAGAGSSAAGSQLPPYESPGKMRLQSAMAAAQLVASLKMMEAETDKTHSEAERNRAEIGRIGESVQTMQVERRVLTYKLEEIMPAEKAELVARVALQEAQKLTEGGRYDESVFHSKVYREMIDEIQAKVKLSNAERHLLEAELPKALNEAAAQKSWYMREVAPYTGEIGKAVGSASQAAGAISNFTTRSYRRVR